MALVAVQCAVHRFQQQALAEHVAEVAAELQGDVEDRHIACDEAQQEDEGEIGHPGPDAVAAEQTEDSFHQRPSVSSWVSTRMGILM